MEFFNIFLMLSTQGPTLSLVSKLLNIIYWLNILQITNQNMLWDTETSVYHA